MSIDSNLKRFWDHYVAQLKQTHGKVSTTVLIPDSWSVKSVQDMGRIVSAGISQDAQDNLIGHIEIPDNGYSLSIDICYGVGGGKVALPGCEGEIYLRVTPYLPKWSEIKGAKEWIVRSAAGAIEVDIRGRSAKFSAFENGSLYGAPLDVILTTGSGLRCLDRQKIDNTHVSSARIDVSVLGTGVVDKFLEHMEYCREK